MHNRDLKVDYPAFIGRTLIVVGITATVVILALLLWYTIDIFLIFFGGVLLAVFLRGMSSWVSHHTPLSEGWSLALALLALLALMGVSSWLLAPGVADQLDQLTQRLPQSAQRLEQQLNRYTWGQQLLADIPNTPGILISSNGVNLLSSATGIFSTTFNFLVYLVIIIFVGFYLAVEPGLYQRGLLHLIPLDKRDRAGVILNELGYTLHWWLLGRLVTMVFIGVLTTIGLWLIGIPLALTLGLLATLLTFIPYIGPVVSAVPAVLLAFLQGPMTAAYVILLYLGLHIVEGYFVTPLVQERAVTLPPAFTIAVQVLLVVLVGFLGLLLATPLAATVMVLVKMLYVEDVLGDSSETLPSEQHKSKRRSERAKASS